MKRAARRAVEGAVVTMLRQIALRLLLLPALRFSLHRLWVFQPSDVRHPVLPVVGAGKIS